MENMKKVGSIFRAIWAFFPIHLLFSQLKYNLIVLFYWIFLFAIINSQAGIGIGLPYLFLSPEYLGSSNYLAFLLVGFSFGGFIMAFHTYSYIQLGPKYPFIATLSRPFFKFSLNNSLIPLVFLVNLVVAIYNFQTTQEFVSNAGIWRQIGSLLLGVVLFVSFAFLYFFPTNKDLFKLTGKRSEDFVNKSSNVNASLHKKQTWYEDFLRKNLDRYYYIGTGLRIKKSRSSMHYDRELLNQVFSQNHINASFFEVILILSFFAIGFFRDQELFQVPASVSIMMLFTIIIMLVSAFFSWLKNWTYVVLIGLFLIINFLSKETQLFQFQSYAFGLSYEQEDLIPYSQSGIDTLTYSDSVVQRDYQNYVKTLENWKKQSGFNKPKLVIVNTSGGGLRSATWTFNVLRHIDSISKRKFSPNVQMVTGASGGMIGAAYFRELQMMEQDSLIVNRLDKQYVSKLSSDLLNRLSFSISTSDIFFRFQKVEINGRWYSKDRGFAFEEELKENLDGVFDRTLGEYKAVEQSGKVPTFIFTPTIINDGRRLLISSQHHGYLQATSQLDKRIGLNPQIENIEYLKYFESLNPEEVRFTSVMRMSATFPYIMPMVTMPTSPGMQIMDAGIRDNYGTKTTVRYLLSLRKWIRENTSGVIVLKIRDSKKTLRGESYEEIGLIERMFLPFSNMYGNFPRVQDFNQDELFSTAVRSLDFPIDVITFNLREEFKDRIALSWHLTKQEKQKILDALNTESNQNALQRLLKKMDLPKD